MGRSGGLLLGDTISAFPFENGFSSVDVGRTVGLGSSLMILGLSFFLTGGLLGTNSFACEVKPVEGCLATDGNCCSFFS